MPEKKDFKFNLGNTYKMEFESSFLKDSIIALSAKRTHDLDSFVEANITVSENRIIATLPNGLKRGDYLYDLEINRNGVITTEFIGSIAIL